MISRVTDFDRMVRYKDFIEVDQQIYDPRVIRKVIQKMQIFFKVQMAVIVKDLATTQLEYHKHYLITVTNKVTDTEHTKKIGFLSGVNTKISLATQYIEFLELVANIPNRVIEVQKEVVY